MSGPQLAAGGRLATGATKAAASAVGLPSPPAWGGYWNWVSATIILMFVFYTAQKGTLSTWVSFFYWTTPANVSSATGNANVGALGGAAGAAVGAVNSAVNSTGLGAAITGLTGTAPLTLGTTGGGLLGALGVGPSSTTVNK